MKQEIYDTVLDILSRKSSFYEGLAELKKTFPDIVSRFGEKTLRSIQAQYYVRRMKRQHHHHYCKETREKYYKLYKDAKYLSERHVIVKLATKNDISPCLLARIILEEYYWNDVHHVGRAKWEGRHSLPSGFMTDFIRDIAKLPNPELATEIYETIVLDNFYGPAVDSIRKTCGAEYEIILRAHCLKAGLSFKDEDQMREEGYDKTPDMKLKVPIMVHGRVVNWIESKASFGDPITHQQYTTDQFLPYKNRFGPGLVIYWFGFIDELTESTERGIVLLDHFPEQGEITRLEDVVNLQSTQASKGMTYKPKKDQYAVEMSQMLACLCDASLLDSPQPKLKQCPKCGYTELYNLEHSDKGKSSETGPIPKSCNQFPEKMNSDEFFPDNEHITRSCTRLEDEDLFNNYVDPMFDSDED